MEKTETPQKVEAKTEAKKEVKNETKKVVSDVKEVVVRANDASISTKHAMAICNFIKHRKIDYSIKFLEEVIKMKKAVPMKGEIPHRKGIGTGRYPVKASAFFIKLLKNLKGRLPKAKYLQKCHNFELLIAMYLRVAHCIQSHLFYSEKNILTYPPKLLAKKLA